MQRSGDQLRPARCDDLEPVCGKRRRRLREIGALLCENLDSTYNGNNNEKHLEQHV